MNKENQSIYSKIYNGIKEFNSSYIFLFKKIDLIIFLILLMSLYIISSKTEFNEYLIKPILIKDIWTQAFSLKLSSEQAGLQLLILISLFANFIFSLLIIIINTALSTYILKKLTHEKVCLFFSFKTGIKTAFAYLNWVFIFTIIDAIIRKLLSNYTFDSLFYLIYLITYITFILITTWTNLQLALEQKKLISALKQSFVYLQTYKWEVLGIFLYLLGFVTLSIIGQLINLLANSYKELNFLQAILDAPLLIIIFILSLLVLLRFPATTVLATQIYSDQKQLVK